MSSDLPDNGEENAESPPSRPRSPSEPPLESEASARSSRVRPFFDLSTVDTFFDLISPPSDDGRIRLYPPFFDYDDQDAWSRGQRDCKHDVVVIDYAIDEYETCDSCGNIPTLGWFYRCGVDTTGYSHQMDPGHGPVLSSWISEAIKAGCYNGVQKEILEQQKLRVLELAARHRDSQMVAFPMTEVIHGIDPDDDDDNPHVDFIEDIAQQDQGPPAIQGSSNVRLGPPHCSYRACHNCAPRLQERVWLSINETCRDTTVRAPSEWDLRDRSISDANVVRNLGLRRFPIPHPNVSRHSHPLAERITSSSPGSSAGPSAGSSVGPSAGPSAGPSVGPSTGPSAGPVTEQSTVSSDGRTGPSRRGLRRLIPRSLSNRSFRSPSLTPSTCVLAPITTQIAGVVTGFFNRFNSVPPPTPSHRELPERRPTIPPETSASPSASSPQTASSSSSEQTPAYWPQLLSYHTAWNSINKHPKRPNLPGHFLRTIVCIPATIIEEHEEQFREPEPDDSEDDDDESGGCPLDPESCE
ncbi:hypothetical protein BO94DRAFT_575160 [Aspergillus sclerotioniger CBS 115572]|uniref:Uncharacterized protein n=1 Tax=Aspergillus sclerotioniger CBS 115572 TaxID=1450535 RepID=A0A317WS62_9EURO|nr:hypothetical protein BO94DRAFT_575160 [Aspergillus sclerotioniger CBS 115572]PWY87020.1 hypothetical protein BO94DRAFT_575160 [Aspergillus sclerotioniger CBS 115572]